jgi:CRP-like cAMP-binding protein
MIKSAAPELQQNQLLSSLRAADLRLLKPFLKTVELGLQKVLIEPNKPIKHLYFPTSGIVSVVTASSRKRQIEVGMIGREGVTGVNVLLGEIRSPHATYVQIAGRGQRINVEDLRKVLKRSASLRDSLLRFAQTLMVQKAYAALAVGQAKTAERLARWLLMAHDRLDGNEIPLTHERLALMLCVQRTGVTAALNLLERRRLIGLKRGVVIVRDRAGLEAVANGFYGAPEAGYRRLIGRNGRDRR